MSSWSNYNKANEKKPPRPILLKSLERFQPDFFGHALDVGCGACNDTSELLRRGWQVTGLDKDDSAIRTLQELSGQFPGKIKAIHEGFEAILLPKEEYDLVNASFSLPFCHPKKFQSFWAGITQSLKPRGRICGQFFGKKDSWAVHNDMTFHDPKEIEFLLKYFTVESLNEKEWDAPSFGGPEKHWHVFMFIAQKT